jgi:hypothetical protein
MMRETAVPVTAEWALWGKESHDFEYRLLAWSDGAVSRDNFQEAITRYSPGTLEDLPQATFSWFSDRDRSSYHRPNYLGLTIHDRPEPGQRDAIGRPVVRTRYYCVPFDQLATGAVSYQAMYEGLGSIELPIESRAPIRAELAVAWPVPPADSPAIRAAALLLTGRPVCILGAEQVRLGDRLQFLDQVASFLPYGMRSRLSASTWVSGAFREHKLRLFFSSPPRWPDAHYVVWGEHDTGPIGDHRADFYMKWLLADPPQRASLLATFTDESGFREPDVLGFLLRITQPPHSELFAYPSRPGTVFGDPPPAREKDPPSSVGETSAARLGWSRLFGPRPRDMPLEDWVTRAVRSAVRRGLLVFNPPAEMTQGRKERVEVGIARSAEFRQELAAGLRGRGEPQFEEVDTSPFMGVELQGDVEVFEITPFSKPEQLVAPLARWEFDVRPRQAGQHDLTLCICLRIMLPRIPGTDSGVNSVPVLQRTVLIKVNVGYGTRRFVASNWQWLIATVTGLGVCLAAWITLFH